ncbi:MAG TPA: prepilin-type N-terminal cleavage/methylation domain-containing protein [Gemmatimonadaceae bacterium]|nr:prepilin-type N-terminal cleavage/methylation domain-containing protein [Gemmatimonadaceae bacterium]
MRTDIARTGFTLLEVLVAVMIAAMLLLSADAVFEQLASSRDDTARSSVTRDRLQNSDALVKSWVRQIDVSPTAGPASLPHAFVGDASESRFTSWCVAAGGWEQACAVSLHTVADSTGVGVVAVSSAGDSARIQMRDSTIALRYLSDAANGGHWVVSWPSGPTVPLAIGIVSPSDTIVYRVGARG